MTSERLPTGKSRLRWQLGSAQCVARGGSGRDSALASTLHRRRRFVFLPIRCSLASVCRATSQSLHMYTSGDSWQLHRAGAPSRDEAGRPSSRHSPKPKATAPLCVRAAQTEDTVLLCHLLLSSYLRQDRAGRSRCLHDLCERRRSSRDLPAALCGFYPV